MLCVWVSFWVGNINVSCFWGEGIMGGGRVEGARRREQEGKSAFTRTRPSLTPKLHLGGL
jgi:hypothetical protein